MKCRKRLHEMTEENTKLDRHGRKHCRACIKKRKSDNHSVALGVGRRNETRLNAYEREMAEALDANPPVIVWRKGKGGVMRAVSVRDSYAERESKPRKPKGLRSIDIEYLEDIS